MHLETRRSPLSRGAFVRSHIFYCLFLLLYIVAHSISVANNEPASPLDNKAQDAVTQDTSIQQFRETLDAGHRPDPILVTELACTLSMDYLRAALDRYTITDLRNELGGSILASACKCDRIESVCIILQYAVCDLEVTNCMGETALHIASIESSCEVVEMLCKLGANPNARAEDGSTPFLRSCMSADALCKMRHMIASGADLSIRDRENNTVLHYVLTNAGEDPYRLVHYLSSIYDISLLDVRSDSGLTPLLLGACSSQIDRRTVDLLIESGLDPSLTDKCGNSPLLLAIAEYNQDTAVELLHHGVSARVVPECGSMRGMSAVHAASQRGLMDVLESCIQRESGLVNERDVVGRTALHHAAIGQSVACIELLLQHGADVGATDKEGRTPLSLYVENGEQEQGLITLLIDGGADVNWVSVSGTSILMNASRLGAPEVVTTLLKYGAKVNVADNDGRTALMHVFLERNYAHLLAQLERSEEMRNVGKGATALDETLHKITEDLRHIVERRGENLNRILLLLLDSGADVKARDSLGSTVAHYAARYGTYESVIILGNSGADFRSRDESGMRPRDYSSQRTDRAGRRITMFLGGRR